MEIDLFKISNDMGNILPLLRPIHDFHGNYLYKNIQYILVDMVLHWGGEPKSHHLAQEDSWRRILEFFSEKLAGGTLNKNKSSKL